MGTPDLDLRHDPASVALRALLAGGCRLPLSLTRPIGQLLGLAAMGLGRRDRRRSRDHLRIAFPEASEERIRRLLRGTARHFGLMLAEVVWLWRSPENRVLELCSIEGEEHLRAALEHGRGAIATTAHCGNWEILNARIQVAGLPLTIAVRQLDSPGLDLLATAIRSRFGGEVVPRGRDAGRRLVSALMRNRINGLLIDQDIRNVPGVFVPFFNRLAWTPSGAANLVLRIGCPALPTFIHRRQDMSHHVVIHPPLPVPTTGDFEDRVSELTAAATAAIERQIRAYPEQWVWMHRRWRTRPPGAESSIA